MARTAAVENYLEGGRRIALLLGCGAAVGEDTSTPATADPPMAGRRQSEPYVRSQFRPPPTHVLHFAWWAVGGPDFFPHRTSLFLFCGIYMKGKKYYTSLNYCTSNSKIGHFAFIKSQNYSNYLSALVWSGFEGVFFFYLLLANMPVHCNETQYV